MKTRLIQNWINYFIATVWIANGLFCKALNLVPRHNEIVERILNVENSRPLTLFIGFAEIGMGIWIISGKWSRLNAVIQIMVIATMNTLEFFLAPDLLLWGKVNAIFASLLILLIYYKEFYHNIKITQQITCSHS